VEITAVNYDVGSTITLLKVPAEGLACEFFSAHCVAEYQVLGLDADFQGLLKQAPSLQGAGGIWGHLQACSDFTEFRGHFHQGDVGSVFAERQRSGKSRHSATDDEDICGRCSFRQGVLLQRLWFGVMVGTSIVRFLTREQ
jgi:hypothetical protein